MAKNTANLHATEDQDTGFNLGGAPAEVSVGAAADTNGDVYDLTGVEEDKAFELIPKGKYSAVTESVEFGESKKGNPMLTIVYELTESEFAKRKLYDYLVLGGDGKDFGLGKLKKFLLRVCPEVDIGAFKPQAFADSGEGVGRECVLQVDITTQKQGEYKGQKRNNVKDVFVPANNFMG